MELESVLLGFVFVCPNRTSLVFKELARVIFVLTHAHLANGRKSVQMLGSAIIWLRLLHEMHGGFGASSALLS
jgi:hypothetical protein